MNKHGFFDIEFCAMFLVYSLILDPEEIIKEIQKISLNTGEGKPIRLGYLNSFVRLLAASPFSSERFGLTKEQCFLW